MHMSDKAKKKDVEEGLVGIRGGGILSVPVTQAQRDRLEKLASKQIGKVSVASILRRAIEEFLDRNEG